MTTFIKKLAAPLFAVALLSAAAPLVLPVPAQASEVKYIVNKQAITSYDIDRRAAFLKLQKRSPSEAGSDMVDQVLRSQEIARIKVNVTDAQLDDSYKRFAESNKLTPAQMDEILNKAGVTKAHFREYMRVQMGWGQVLGMRARSEGRMSEQDVVQRMMKEGRKPSATEYLLQQVIFVVPAAERGSMLGKRKREADAMRARFNGCDSTRSFAKGLIDVTVRDLGRVLEPELPSEWSDQIKSTKAGGATGVKETARGVEFIGVCSQREVSNDRVARMVFGAEDASKNEGGEALSKKYTEELHKRGQIVKR
ncbi:peptidylprolyl isomerase [Tianweitania populi]|uniref:Molecular chaperone SurA n=1 Tax=Tianweitania populi TaxID=1607949 RepID=A0A8J3DU20_9HYPH|nr:peptidylprolyl isomerase [Tianweitania populi]GHD07044.1 molecular chaperone SurA [Tianweitania populi]